MSSSASSWIKFWSERGSEDRDRKSKPPSQKATVASDFIRGKTKDEEAEEIEFAYCNGTRRWARKITTNPYVTQFMAFVVLFDAFCNCSDIDARARAERAPEGLLVGSILCLVLYTSEMALQLFGQGGAGLTDKMFILDAGIVVCGYVELLLSLAASSLSERIGVLSILRLLRLGRVVRLLRIFGKIRALRELQKLVTMMSTCMKALLWSFVFCFLIMTVWAMLLVELVFPLIQELHATSGTFHDCDHCLRATSSVMSANLLLFKTVIAGDGWGLVAIPVIEAFPATAIIFMGSQLTLVFGVLNLIVAVVVDTFADARDRDILTLAEELELELEADKTYLERMFDRIDVDGSGHLSLEQLVEGAKSDPEFQSRLRVMDIDEVDLEQLFEMIDTDHSGFIEPNEFIRPLSRWVHDSKTAPRFIKYNTMRTMMQQEEIRAQQWELRGSMEKHFKQMTRRLEKLSACPGVEDCGFEGVEQPKPSQRFAPGFAGTKADAVYPEPLNRLERMVVEMTESSLKKCTDLVQEVLSELGKSTEERGCFEGQKASCSERINLVTDTEETVDSAQGTGPLGEPSFRAQSQGRHSLNTF